MINHPLYPYHVAELTVVFIYGKHFTRRMNILLIPESIQIITTMIIVFASLGAYILYFIRRRLHLRRDGLSSTFIDTMITFIGGGNVRIVHKYEKWFFGILSFGAFFIISVFSGDLLDCFVRILHEKVNSFEKLAFLNSPIFINVDFREQSDQIHSMLRFYFRYIHAFRIGMIYFLNLYTFL